MAHGLSWVKGREDDDIIDVLSYLTGTRLKLSRLFFGGGKCWAPPKKRGLSAGFSTGDNLLSGDPKLSTSERGGGDEDVPMAGPSTRKTL